MNIGILLLALMLVGGSIFGIIMIGSASQTTYTDTFGTVQGNTSNSTMGTITNTTAPLMDASAGIGFIVVVFLLAAAAIYVFGAMKYHGERR